MKKCDCYYEEDVIVAWSSRYGQIRRLRTRCNGTKERDVCSCGGDRTKCDFYYDVREKAKQDIAITDAISHFKYGISHDIFNEPVMSYAKMAVEALEKQLNNKE